jgi:hypothetical protein
MCFGMQLLRASPWRVRGVLPSSVAHGMAGAHHPHDAAACPLLHVHVIVILRGCCSSHSTDQSSSRMSPVAPQLNAWRALQGDILSSFPAAAQPWVARGITLSLLGASAHCLWFPPCHTSKSSCFLIPD